MPKILAKTPVCTAFLGTLVWLVMTGGAGAQDRRFDLEAPGALIETGFLKYLVPRFTLKHSTRITMIESGGAADGAARILDAPGGPEARAVFSGEGVTYYLMIPADNEHAARFARWLSSDIGKKTITGFAPDSGLEFTAAKPEAVKVVREVMAGNATNGGIASRQKCGRCHVVDKANRMNGIGSTPSFFVLRTFDDWQDRFAGFYALNPHPSFTQIAGITPPFDPDRPPPISPLEMKISDVDDIVAYVAGLPPADLGAPIIHQ